MFKKIIPKKIKNLRHLFYAWWGSVKYKHPSEELLVIGITGTTGKSSVIHFLRQVLESASYKVGSLSTVDFYIGGQEKLNDQKMTMLGKMQIQKYLREMVDEGCDIAIVETTSEGRLQYRHKFINYDMMVLTNLYPEHIESHGSFENYKQAKLDLFSYVANCRRKKGHKTYDIGHKICIVNSDSEYCQEFLNYDFDRKITYQVPHNTYHISKDGLEFEYEGYKFYAHLYGKHNIENLVCVINIARAMDIPWQDIQNAVAKLQSPPGRIEFITSTSLSTSPKAEEFGFQVIVDYAFEPKALQALYDVVDVIMEKSLRQAQGKKIIHVCGSTGGGRDKARRDKIGRLVGEKADVFIITDEDPYDEDPKEIMEAVKKGALAVGKEEGKDLFMILDRGEAIKKAIELAEVGDLVLVTGKGSEQAMCVAGGKMVPWDDREQVHKYLFHR